MLPPSPHGLLHDPTHRCMWKWVWVSLIAVVGIAALSPGESAPSMTTSDKVDHVLGFAALSAAGVLALAPGLGRTVLAGFSMLAYGAAIEMLQTQIPGRFGDLQDGVADAVGIALGVAIITSLRWLFREDRR